MSESLIITPETESAGMDLDLFLRIMPSVRVGDRIVSTVGIEHVEYQDIVNEDGDNDTQLAISYQSGCVYFFDQEEEMELERVLKAAIQKSEQIAKEQAIAQQQMMQQAAQDALIRASVNPGAMPGGRFGKRH